MNTEAPSTRLVGISMAWFRGLIFRMHLFQACCIWFDNILEYRFLCWMLQKGFMTGYQTGLSILPCDVKQGALFPLHLSGGEALQDKISRMHLVSIFFASYWQGTSLMQPNAIDIIMSSSTLVVVCQRLPGAPLLSSPFQTHGPLSPPHYGTERPSCANPSPVTII